METSNAMQAAFTAVLTAVLTVAGTQWLTARQNERTDHSQFIDGAQATAQETSRLLYEGYNQLEKLLNASAGKDWKDFAPTGWQDYREFHREWRQHLIGEHFKLARYFGRDVANQLIHVDEIDLLPINNLGSPHPCTPPGDKTDFDIAKLADQAECQIRMITVTEDIIRDAPNHDWSRDNVLDYVQSKRDEQDFSQSLLTQYDQSTVRILRVMDDRLTQLGEPEIKVVRGSN